MKIKDGFVLRTVADHHVVVSVGMQNLNFKNMIKLNDTGAFLWQQLQTDRSQEELTAALLETYEVDEATAKRGVESFVTKLREADLLL